jgi:hypothetical protein
MLAICQQGVILSNAIMSSATFESLADKQVLHLTTIGRVTGRAREIEIWFIVYHEKFYDSEMDRNGRTASEAPLPQGCGLSSAAQVGCGVAHGRERDDSAH